MSREVKFLEDPAPRDDNRIIALDSRLERGLAPLRTERLWLKLRLDSQAGAGLPVSGETHRMDEKALLELVLERSNQLPACFLEVGAHRASAVCKISTSGTDYEGRAGQWSGTGFLVSPNILLTNHHVLNSPDVATRATCLFKYQADETGGVGVTQTYRLNPSRLFITSPARNGLDYTFVWVEGEPGSTHQFIPLDRSAFKVTPDEFANAIHHPRGGLKAVTLQENRVIRQSVVTVHYTTDTESGSSGAPIFNNEWAPIALHHASREAPKDGLPTLGETGRFLNEGILFSAIAADLERRRDTGRDTEVALEILSLFRGTDALSGFFGTLGRPQRGNADFEYVVNAYRGEAGDVDVGFWNVEHFERDYARKVDEVARMIASMNLDVWALSESSARSAELLARRLREDYGLDFRMEASEPGAPHTQQTVTVLWNAKTVKLQKEPWPQDIERWLHAHTEDFDGLDLEPQRDSEGGRIFPRYPALYRVSAANGDGGHTLDFFLLPLHLKAFASGSQRRRLATRILSVAVDRMINQYGKDEDWVIGGDLNAALASEDFSHLSQAGHLAASAEDEGAGAITYVKAPHRSFIDHVFLSPNLAKTYGAKDFFVVAADRTLPTYLTDLSDHRPVLIRMSLNQSRPEASRARRGGSTPHAGLMSVLNQLTAEATAPEPPRRPATSMVPPRASLETGLERLEESRRRTYYDAAADTQARNDYYRGLPSRPSFEDLSRLVKQSHTRPVSYRRARAEHLYTWVDLHPDWRLRSIYSGKPFSPEEILRLDAEVERARAERLRELFRPERMIVYEDLTEEAARLESDLPYNCEHVVPQSWFREKEPMRGDLHHLFTCESRCNSFRSNTPYFDFKGGEEAWRDECGRSENNGFEPVHGKGAVARATLYFLVRYPGIVNDSSAELEAERLQVLLSWHRADPVSDHERHRNQAIHEVQGNRNPFIDRPEWADHVDFRLGLGD
ncbi:endonuclease [Myxococcus sp. RHSTA-1-4]|uniref:endonuclease n=1 Tax=Myxococcus sp. RHSTA-1-4 TaxID=2874601 RepID=UPI001CBD808F|nr:endonuclease [Myxococcus sp. RHSTA-1-4]MBZ4415804.1 endonuclease [Myxococcus sp. RHSTA-1-4]